MLRVYIALLALVLVLGGCASTGVDLVKENNIALQADNSPKGEIRSIKVRKYNDKVLITGLIAKNKNKRLLKGHVHIDVFDKSNNIQQTIESDYRFRRSGASRTASAARFTASLDVEPSPDSRVVITHHDAKTKLEPQRATPELAPIDEGGSGIFTIE